MKSIKLRVLSLALCSSIFFSGMAAIEDLPVKVVNGRTYHYYLVQPKETIYSLCQKLGVSKNEIYRYNPSAADGLRANQVLLFPASENPDGKTIVHIVAKGETVYGISKAYGITTSQLLDWNPAAKDGLRVGQRLAVSQPKSNATEETTDDSTAYSSADDSSLPAQKGTVRYTIKPGQTLYRIAIEHFTTIKDILALNPGLDSENYQAGQEILIPSINREHSADLASSQTENENDNTAIVENQSDNNNNTKVATYVVKRNETFYSIARAHNLTVEALENANPSVGALKEGMILTIPAQDNTMAHLTTDKTETDETTPEESIAYLPGSNDITGALKTETVSPDEDANPTTEDPTESINIALTLPFMLQAEHQSRQAQLFTEFYKGFLLAVDSLRDCGTPINVYAFDTSSSIDTLRTLLTRPEMKDMQVIIAPDAEAQISELAKFGKENDINILNLFVVKDQTYKTTPYLMQGNIPHGTMYAKAIKGLVERFESFTPVILSRKNGASDKAEYVSALKKYLNENGIVYKTIEFEGLLNCDDIMALGADGHYAFVPVSGKQTELNYIIPALTEFKERSTEYDPIRLFGYPEWTTFRGETQDNMHKINTVVYSRFYTVPDDPALQEIENKFVHWYGKPMANYVPRQGLFGFDAGMYLIRALIANGGDFNKLTPSYSGVQNGFNFTGDTGAGMVNDELYFINFRPSGLIDKVSL